jgi:hypothetical protein
MQTPFVPSKPLPEMIVMPDVALIRILFMVMTES